MCPVIQYLQAVMKGKQRRGAGGRVAETVNKLAIVGELKPYEALGQVNPSVLPSIHETLRK